MIPLSSSITGEVYAFSDIEQELHPLGFRLSDNWDYEHGYFDYKIDSQDGYHFLRIPFSVTAGSLDSPYDSSLVRVEEPFLLAHIYQDGLDDHVREGNFRAAFDQFQEPKDKDGHVPERYVNIGRELIENVEQALTSKRSEHN
ncbi:YugN-like family protein [Halobacillus salinarum]|uniref:YugN-like family protein n=1 Tax=Halobacillus salinarum TaxID=2932257 RepID=A0ABY4ENN9_9BACI|nr:YugN-like family protein [Halobacillus salinarum]UOQ46071.1 YugN-like family protein [Halobacillus salinarum]